MKFPLFPALLIAALAPLPVIGLPAPAPAHTIEAGDLEIIHPNSRPNLPNRPAVAYAAIANNGATPDRLLGASSPVFKSAEMHSSTMTNGMMSMAPVTAIDLPPGDTVELAPGGFHIMLFGASKLYQAGDMFPMVLHFEHAGDVSVEVMVQPMGGGDMGGMKMDHGTMGQPQPSN